MSTETLVLRQDKSNEKPRGTRERRISQKEWPTILERHANGESINAIARDYGVTGPAIRYIVNKARKSSGEQPIPAAGAENTAETTSPAAAADSGSETEAPATADTTPEEKPAPAPAPAIATGRYTKEAVKRLAAAAAACCETVENAGNSARELAEVKARLHDVRRALAAIEIDVWKHESRR